MRRISPTLPLMVLFLLYSSGLFSATLVVVYKGGFSGSASYIEGRVQKSLDTALSNVGFEVALRKAARTASEFSNQVAQKAIKSAPAGLFFSGSEQNGQFSISLRLVSLERGEILMDESLKATADTLDDLDGAMTATLKKGMERLSSGTASGPAARRQTVAVLDFEAVGVSKIEAMMIGDLVREALVKQGRFTILDRKNMNAILKEQSFQASGCTTEECRVQMGQLLNAELVMSGQLVKVGNAWQVTAKSLDVATAKFVNVARVDVADLAKAGPAIEQLVESLAETPAERLAKKEALLKVSRRNLTLSIIGTGVMGLTALGLQLASDDSLRSLGLLYTDYQNQTITAQATALGDRLDKTRQDTDTLLTLRDTALIAAGALLVTDVLLGLRVGALERSLKGEQSLKLTVLPTPTGLHISASMQF